MSLSGAELPILLLATRRHLVALLLGLAALTSVPVAADEESEPDPETPRIVEGGPRPRVALQVTGPEASPGKVERCHEVAQDYGIAIDGAARVKAVLYLAEDANELRIHTPARTLRWPRPGWGMKELCRDAMAHAVRAFYDEQRGAAPPPRNSPTPPGGSSGAAAGAKPGSSTPSNAVAQAKRLHQRASEAFKLAQYDIAIDAWVQAYEIDHRAELLFNIGRAFQRRGERNGYLADLRRARSYFRKYIAAAKEVRLTPEDMEQLEEEIRRREKAGRK